MQERQKIQTVPVKVYRSADRITVAAPLPGLQPEDILVTVTEEGHLVIYGEVRGMLKDIKELLVDEWSVGEYHRELELAEPVDGSLANVTYGNGILVVSLPRSTYSTTAVLRLEKVGLDRGEHVGLAGHVEDSDKLLGGQIQSRARPLRRIASLFLFHVMKSLASVYTVQPRRLCIHCFCLPFLARLGL